MMKNAHKTGIILGLGVLLSTASACFGQSSRMPVATTPHFVFYSDFDANLNDALINAGVARKFGKPQLFREGDEAACFLKLPVSARSAWERAVDYYAEIISPGGSNTRQRYLLRVQLAGYDEELKDADARQFVEIAQSFRAAATPAYKACRWAAQDEKNRKWIEVLKPQLGVDEQRVASRLEQLYQKRWTGLPIPVDIVQTVDFSGANTILGKPGSGHLLIANENEASYALEVIFHESSHILMDHNDPVRLALNKAASAANFKLPGDLWHVVLFYTTGEAVRRILDDEGKPGYKPMVYGIFERGVWGDYRNALENAWKPYVDNKQTLPEAAASLMDMLQKQPQH
jgi:hypothetical protein